MLRKRVKRIIFLVALALGGLQLGQGSYIQAKALLSQFLLNSAWKETLEGGSGVKPWPWADTWPVGKLRLPEYDIDLIVLAGASGHTLAFGPGHLDGSALPGRPGNSIISAHRDTHFRFLKSVRRGDRIQLQEATGVYHDYRVMNIHIVDARKPVTLDATDKSMLTLVTCYPFDAVLPGGPMRYVVIAEEVNDGIRRDLLVGDEAHRVSQQVTHNA